MVLFTTTMYMDDDKTYVEVGLFIDDAEEFKVRFLPPQKEDFGVGGPISISHLVTDLPVGNHDFEIRWRVGNNKETIEQLAGSWGTSRTFAVIDFNNP